MLLHSRDNPDPLFFHNCGVIVSQHLPGTHQHGCWCYDFTCQSFLTFFRRSKPAQVLNQCHKNRCYQQCCWRRLNYDLEVPTRWPRLWGFFSLSACSAQISWHPYSSFKFVLISNFKQVRTMCQLIFHSCKLCRKLLLQSCAPSVCGWACFC